MFRKINYSQLLSRPTLHRYLFCLLPASTLMQLICCFSFAATFISHCFHKAGFCTFLTINPFLLLQFTVVDVNIHILLSLLINLSRGKLIYCDKSEQNNIIFTKKKKKMLDQNHHNLTPCSKKFQQAQCVTLYTIITVKCSHLIYLL